jgi:peptidoglycan-N-acetylglucosamine deacetylase
MGCTEYDEYIGKVAYPWEGKAIMLPVKAIICATSGASALAATIAYGVGGRSSQLFGPSVYRGAGARRTIALTFDDGPSPGTSYLLDYLAEQNIKATFFQCGANVRRHPLIAREVVARGHEVGNHSESHARLCPRIGWKLNILSPGDIYREFAMAQEAIHSTSGALPRLMRAPYGLRWFGIGAMQRKLNLLGVMWTVIGRDWEWPGSKVSELVLAKAAPAGIICLHDGRDIRPHPDISQTIAAVKKIVPVLKGLGYRFETVSDLLRPDPC